jgi:hypothetical protein
MTKTALGSKLFRFGLGGPSDYVPNQAAESDFIKDGLGSISKILSPTDQNPSKYVKGVPVELNRIQRLRAGRVLAHCLSLGGAAHNDPEELHSPLIWKNSERGFKWQI